MPFEGRSGQGNLLILATSVLVYHKKPSKCLLLTDLFLNFLNFCCSPEQKKNLLSDTASLSSESDHEGPSSNVSTTEIPPPSELKEEGIACSTVMADPPPYSESVPPVPAVGGPVWGQPPIATGATQQQATTIVVVRRPTSEFRLKLMAPLFDVSI